MSEKVERNDINVLAQEMRYIIRLKAGLSCDWNKASEGMKSWYRKLAQRALDRQIKYRET